MEKVKIRQLEVAELAAFALPLFHVRRRVFGEHTWALMVLLAVVQHRRVRRRVVVVRRLQISRK